jgi:glycopeptide antibiotics resistance protein
MIKKIAVLLPTILLSLFYFRVRYHSEFASGGMRGKASLAIGLLLMFCVMFFLVRKLRQENILQGLIQSGFFVYFFMVLTLTGYFLLFREVTERGWWHHVVHRVSIREHVNLQPFLMFKQFRLYSKQVLGNAVMLLPLGIFIPLLWPRLSNFFIVFFICLGVTVGIELMQLITNYRSSDIDDVILNTAGAVVGYILFALVRFIFVPRKRKTSRRLSPQRL